MIWINLKFNSNSEWLQMTYFNERFSTRTAFEKRSIFQRIHVNSHKAIQLFLAVNLEASQVFLVQTKALLSCMASRISKSIYSRQKSSKHRIHEYINWKSIYYDQLGKKQVIFEYFTSHIRRLSWNSREKLNSLLSGMCELHHSHNIID